ADSSRCPQEYRRAGSRQLESVSRLVPPGWTVRAQVGTILTTSRPEPDAAVARGSERVYFTRHPDPADLALVVEVADSSLAFVQQDKFRIYARDRIPVYWIVNLIDRRVEVHTDPSGPGDDPRYHTLRVFPAGSAVPVELDGVTVGTVPVDELLP
ncbi:MAG: Uma2 family endonuclease, partial [Gemmataceae bacterium]|nr:Uma2 family endonuclease [Gemmataceae bacterium]